MDKKKEKKEKVYSIEEELLKEEQDVDVVDPNHPKTPPKKS